MQNTTAIALYLLEYSVSREYHPNYSVFKERNHLYDHIKKGQRKDGFWPYVYSGWLQQLGFRFGYSRYIPIIRRLIFRRDDKSVFFGDSTHHCLVYYFHLKASLLTQKRSCGKYLINGWKWILEKLKENSDGGKAFDFSWEPRPHRPRFCNFQDTNTYFLILASIPLMSKLGLEEENLE